jgi:hypothetical protein
MPFGPRALLGVTKAIHRPSSEILAASACTILTRCGVFTGFPVTVSRSTDHTCATLLGSPLAINTSRRPDADIDKPSPKYAVGMVAVARSIVLVVLPVRGSMVWIPRESA